MKILHAAETLPGGPAAYLNELLPFQTAAYERVTVLCPESQRHHLTCEKAEVVTYSDTKRTPAGLLHLHRQWRDLLRRESFDVMHLHSSFAGLVGRLLWPVPATRTVYCAHGWAHSRPGHPARNAAFKLVERLLAGRTDAIINVSRDEERLALSAGITPDKCKLVYSGLRDADYRPVENRDGPVRLLFVGRYDEQKGIDLLLDAMDRLSRRGFVLDMIGAPVVGKQGVKISAPGTIDLGWQQPEQVRAAMALSDIIVMPSRWEALGLVAVEAMRAARPVAAAAVGGLRECVIDGNTGVLFEPGSCEAVVEALDRIAKMDLRALGLSARRRFESEFKAERMFEQVDACYRSGSNEELTRHAQKRPGTGSSVQPGAAGATQDDPVPD